MLIALFNAPLCAMKNNERDVGDLGIRYKNRPKLLLYKHRIAQSMRGWGELLLLPCDETAQDDFNYKDEPVVTAVSINQWLYNLMDTVPHKRVKTLQRELISNKSTQLLPLRFSIVKHSRSDRFSQLLKNKRDAFFDGVMICFGSVYKLSRELFCCCKKQMAQLDVNQLKKTESNLADLEWDDILGE